MHYCDDCVTLWLDKPVYILMNLNIEEMITLNYELEGLLYLALHRGDDTPQQVWDMISAKIEALREGLATGNATACDNTPASISAEEVPANDNAGIYPDAEEEPTDIEQIQATEPDETEQPDNTPDAGNNDLQPLPEPEEAQLPPTPDEILTVIKEEELEAAESEPLEEPSFTEPENGYVPYSEPEVKIAQAESIRLDEKLARENSRNLRKAFSLNDKFRFRRELFSNSESEMTEAINTIEAMSSIDEALDYFYNDLNWDKSSQEVKDFIEIITHHFSSK